MGKSGSFGIIKNFSATFISNLLSFAVSTLVILILPKWIGVEEYGYWQLYLFYLTYVGVFHFGWNDGIYLRYGGYRYESLNKQLFFSQFYLLIGFQLLVLFLIYVLSTFFIIDSSKIFILKMTAINMLLLNTNLMLLYILQATNRIKEYAQNIILSKLTFVILTCLILLGGLKNYRLIIIADVFSKIIGLLHVMYFCKDIVFRKIVDFYIDFSEILKNISAGIKLMFANFASILIIGVIRFGIEQTWDVATFGKISLTLSISNLMMLFINSVGIILFPLLRRTPQERLPLIYTSTREIIMIPLIGILLFYYPLKEILSIWLPNYAESLNYMALLFPIIIYEGKMSLLLNTYLKTLRKEGLILRINLISFVLSVIITFFTTFVLINITLTVLSIVIILAFRSIYAEVLLSKLLGIAMSSDIVLEIALTVLFILTFWYFNSWYALGLYAFFYGSYFIYKRKNILSSVSIVKSILNNNHSNTIILT